MDEEFLIADNYEEAQSLFERYLEPIKRKSTREIEYEEFLFQKEEQRKMDEDWVDEEWINDED